MSVAERGLATGANLVTLSHIQPFAALIAVTSDWVITHISENIDEFLDIDASVIGHTLDHVLLDEAVHDIRGILNATAGQSGMGRVLGSDLRSGCGQYDLTVHVNDTGFILEIEPSEALPRIDDIGMIRGLIERVKQATTLEDVSHKAARSIRALTGFDSVAICAVHGDGSCAPIAHAHILSAAAPEETRFVLSDVVPHTDASLTSQLFMTADVDARGVGLLSAIDQDPLDLSHAISAAATPKSAAFLKASGAKASLAISIVKDGKLEGLVFCHHRKPLRTGFRTRMLVGLFVDLFTYEFVAAASNNRTKP